MGSSAHRPSDGAVGYVGYDPSLDTIIVGHQGTDAKKMYGSVACFSLAISQSAGDFSLTLRIPILTDVNFIHINLDSSLFPGVSSNVKVHAGFSIAHKL